MFHSSRPGFLLLFALLTLVLPSCGKSPPADPVAARFPDPNEKNKPQVGLLKNEIPPEQLDAVLRAHYQGLGFMEQYEYRKATIAFREVVDRAPGWIPGSINLAIALLNDTGTQEESKKAGGGGTSAVGFDRALELLNDVVSRDPANLSARYCRGLILEFLGQGRTADAHTDFLYVAEHDPCDGHAWLKVGATLTSTENPGQPAGPKEAGRLIEIYSRALACNPYLITAHYKLQQAYGWARQPEKQRELLDRWRRLNPKSNPSGPGDTAEAFYGEAGKYARIIDPFPNAPRGAEPGPPPRFAPPAAATVKSTFDPFPAVNFAEPVSLSRIDHRVRERFGTAICTFDADGDGRTDLFIPSALIAGEGTRDLLLFNRGDGRFEDMTIGWGLSNLSSLSAAAGDFDADRRIDLFLTGPTGYHLFRNVGTKFLEVTAEAGMDKADRLGLNARWLDLDQDGDLDLYVVNFTDLGHADQALLDRNIPQVRNTAYRNDGKPPAVTGRPQDNWAPLAVATPDLQVKSGLSIAFTPWPETSPLLGPPGHYTAIAALDLDDDRDLDLLLGSDDKGLVSVTNRRLGEFRNQPVRRLDPSVAVDHLLSADLDKDGHTDLAALPASGTLQVWRNATAPGGTVPPEILLDRWPSPTSGWKTAIAADLDLDTWPDLIGLPRKGPNPGLDWLRNDGQKLLVGPSPIGPLPPEVHAIYGFALADVVGDALPDLILVPDQGPLLVARNMGNGNHWLALDLGGQWKTSFDHMRTNPHGLGTRITLEGQGLLVTHEQTTPAATLAQSVGPTVLGLGKTPAVELVRLRWPDGTMQCELNQKADVLMKLTEVNRKTGSCPVLFTWNGERFECLGDFLGGGGLGYLVAPGVYGQPDRDESVAISSEQLRAVNGTFRLSVTEPMDEVAYLDRLQLVVVDRPPGVSSTPDERFAPEGPRPTGDEIAWKTAIETDRATDLNGRDVTETLRHRDRKTVDGFRRLDGWIGYADEHGIILDFGDRLSRFGPADPLVLALAGWVEYPYSQTNYAAATAGVALRPPVIERRGDDGTWTVIEPHAGYPAGLPRLTTLDLTGKLTGPRCVLRLRTNMELYWDQAFLAVRDPLAEAGLRQTTLPVARAVLGHRGYSREVSPDGRLPLLYDYDHVDPAPLALMGGMLTRYGDVRGLLLDDDDQLCLVGPGDEVRLEFDQGRLPELRPGWTRSYVLKAVGYCKDADPFTATSDTVGPLPWRGMPDFPFRAGVRRPTDPADRGDFHSLLTRPAGAR